VRKAQQFWHDFCFLKPASAGVHKPETFGRREKKMKTENKRQGRPRILFGGLLALALVLAVCLWWHGRQIPADFSRRAAQALTAAGFDSGHVQAVDGRVVILSGEIDDEANRQRLVEAVASVAGVRRVIDNLTIIQADLPSSDAAKVDNRVKVAVSQRPASLQVRITEKTVLIQGELSDRQSADQLVAAARSI
jgi:cell division protein FtsB